MHYIMWGVGIWLVGVVVFETWYFVFVKSSEFDDSHTVLAIIWPATVVALLTLVPFILFDMARTLKYKFIQWQLRKSMNDD